MSSRSRPWLRNSVVAIAVLALAVCAGWGESPPAAAPVISAASRVTLPESAVSELTPAFEWLESTTAPATDGLTTARIAPATDISTTATVVTATDVSTTATVVPATEGEAEVVTGDPRGADAMVLIAFPWRPTLPGWSIAFLPAQTGLRGLTKVGDRRIEIYVRDSDSAASLARIVAHELGHAVDVELNSPGDRERWRVARGVAPSVSWWPVSSVSDFDTLAGDFAEAFATMLTGSVSLSRVAPPPGTAELAVLAELATR